LAAAGKPDDLPAGTAELPLERLDTLRGPVKVLFEQRL
jgi:hypothetical protein